MLIVPELPSVTRPLVCNTDSHLEMLNVIESVSCLAKRVQKESPCLTLSFVDILFSFLFFFLPSPFPNSRNIKLAPLPILTQSSVTRCSVSRTRLDAFPCGSMICRASSSYSMACVLDWALHTSNYQGKNQVHKIIKS